MRTASFKSFVVALADEGEAFIFQTTGILAGEIDGDGVPLKKFLTKIFCEFPTFVDGDAFGWVNFNRVNGPDTRVATALFLHIDEFVSHAGRVKQCLSHCLGTT